MTTITEHTALADIVTAQPGLARELEARGLDYCCGGAATLADACRANDLAVDAVLVALAAVEVDEATPSWAAMDVAELVDHLEATHHRYLWAELPRLSMLADKVRLRARRATPGTGGRRHLRRHDPGRPGTAPHQGRACALPDGPHTGRRGSGSDLPLRIADEPDLGDARRARHRRRTPRPTS